MKGFACIYATALLVTQSVAQKFIIPPDSNSGVKDLSLTYNFGQFIDAQWWTDWQNVTLEVLTCGGKTSLTNFGTGVANENGGGFTLAGNLASRCTDYTLRVTAVTDANGNPAPDGLAINSQNFRIVNASTPAAEVGSFTETLVIGDGSSKTTLELATTITASFTALWTFTGTATSSTPTQTGSAAQTAGPSAAASSAPASTPQASNSGMQTSAKIGLGVGLGLGLPLLFGLAALLFLRRRAGPRATEMRGENNFGIHTGQWAYSSPGAMQPEPDGFYSPVASKPLDPMDGPLKQAQPERSELSAAPPGPHELG